MTLRDLKLRVRALLAPRRVEHELDEELEFHLEREAAKLVERGLSPADARRQARAKFGSVALTADECRDARGIAFIDQLTRDVTYAFRTFRRAPLSALTIVATIALGLGLVAVVFTFYSALVLRTDAVRAPHELFEVRRSARPGATVWAPVNRPQFEALRRETDVFTDAFATLDDIETRVGGRPVAATLVTGGFFQILGALPVSGRTLAPADDGPVVVLSHRGWSKLFPDGADAAGQTLPINGWAFTVVGVMPPDFRGLQLVAPDYWAPMAQLGHLSPSDLGREDDVALDVVVGRLNPGVSREVAAAALTAWAIGSADLPAGGDNTKTIQLIPKQGAVYSDPLQALQRFAPIFLAFGLILLIGCANVANLLLARGVARQREIGIRLSLGASRRRIVRQLLTESVLLAFAAAVCGFYVSRGVIDAAVRFTMAAVQPDTAEFLSFAAVSSDWRVFVFLVAGALVSTLFFAVVPAFHATRLELVRTMRGEVMRDARPGLARHSLLTIQVGASALLLVCAAVFLRGALRAASIDPGIRTADTVFIEGLTEDRRGPLLQVIDADPAIAAVAATYPRGFRGEIADASPASASPDAGGPPSVPVNYKFVSPEYFDLLEIDLVEGRGFRPDERSPTAGVAVVSDETAAELWPDREAIGQTIHLDPWEKPGMPRRGSSVFFPTLPFRAFVVVGIVPHFRLGIGDFKQFGAGVYLPVDAASAGTSLVARVTGDPDEARRQLGERFSSADPALGDIWTLRTLAGRGTFLLQLSFWITAVLAALALALTASGLFGVLSYLVEQRRKEIGVRMALGALPGAILRMILRQSLRPVAFGVMTGAAGAGVLANALLALPVAGRIGEVVRLLDPMAYGTSLLCIVLACMAAVLLPAVRAARVDPIAALREE
jgi:predicted permease